ncbi:glutathione S-transferase N-terminal domain-containing protein [Psychromonas sp. SP041]|uniref:glutathione S-transferase family protein n=1 Tax=Psychromonas sp. SP041 TaxID=1365007 RepID=UPI0004278566|nr:glutathione S-transferase N-terminal domain-containing protein [Psychromonas sp. SP041]
MELIVGKDSTWSLRVWICGQLTNIDFNIKVIDLTDADYKAQVLTFSPSGLVPALIDNSLVVHDSLAIIEYLNEQSNGELFPDTVNERAIARSLCSELHSGFMNLRGQCSFTLEKVNPLSTLNDGIKNEISRIETIFEQAQLPYMFEKVGVVDAFYSILAYRLKTYGIMLNGKAGDYQQSLLDWDFLQEAIKQAKVWESK